MNKYQEIMEARKLLRLRESATMEEIKSNYRTLLSEWHPDKCLENQERRNEMTRKIISAYKIIMHYCQHYQYSFSEEAVKRHLSPEEWWFEHFGGETLY
ncbi:MAG: J domain-containing protein [Deltaproteobacteria bacterium]|nr:J domain-containing protein [Deltaproteobacteria bacterium]